MPAAQSRFDAVVRRAERSLVPISVMIELTRRCNLRCLHCYLTDTQASAPAGIPTPRLLQLLDELAASGTLFLTFTGGEALCRPDWQAVARRAHELGFSVRLLTSATLVDTQAAETLRDIGAAVEVSLYSVDAAAYESVTRVRGSCARALGGIELLCAKGVPLLLKVPMTIHNWRDVPAVFAYAERLGVECVSDPQIIPAMDGDRRPTRLRVPPSELLEYYRGPYASCTPPCPVPPQEDANAPVCAAGVRMACVAATGEVLPCSCFPLDAGNILERGFGEIWSSSPVLQRLRRIRRRDLHVCDTCEQSSFCRRCPADALLEDGDLLGPSRWSCEHAAAIERAFEPGSPESESTVPHTVRP